MLLLHGFIFFWKRMKILLLKRIHSSSSGHWWSTNYEVFNNAIFMNISLSLGNINEGSLYSKLPNSCENDMCWINIFNPLKKYSFWRPQCMFKTNAIEKRRRWNAMLLIISKLLIYQIYICIIVDTFWIAIRLRINDNDRHKTKHSAF